MVSDLPPDSWPVAASEEQFSNWLIAVRNDKVQLPDGQHADRTVVTHIGAVAVLALDAHDRVLMIRQYRHPVSRQLWEIPAGLRDVTGESLADTARRELLEETGYAASQWDSLIDSYASPGIITERIRIFLARGLTTAESAYQREGEEKFLRTAWIPLEEAMRAALAGKLHTARLSKPCSLGISQRQKDFQGFAPRTRRRSSRVRGRRSPRGSTGMVTDEGRGASRGQEQ